MSKEITTFGNTELERRKLHHLKNIAFLGDVGINNMQVSTIIFITF